MGGWEERQVKVARSFLVGKKTLRSNRPFRPKIVRWRLKSLAVTWADGHLDAADVI